MPRRVPTVGLSMCEKARDSSIFSSSSSSSSGDGPFDRSTDEANAVKNRREPAGAESLFSTAKLMRGRLAMKATTATSGSGGRERRGERGRTGPRGRTRRSYRGRSHGSIRLRRRLWTLVRQIRFRRKLRRRGKGRESVREGGDGDDDPAAMGCDAGDLERMRASITLPPWALCDAGEGTRLAAMKLLVEDDMAEARKRTVRLPGGGLKAVSVAEAFPDVYGDLRLLRFLRKDDPQDFRSAASRYREFLRWRRDGRIDILVRSDVEEKPFQPPHPIVAQRMPYEFFHDRHRDFSPPPSSSPEGQRKQEQLAMIPIALSVGDWETGAIADLILGTGRYHPNRHEQRLSLDDFLRHWVYLFESLHRQLYRESLRRKRMVYVDEICDLSGMSMGQLSVGFVTGILKPWLKVTQTYYPETTGRISVLNPPAILSVAWKIVSPMVSENTLAKIRFFHRYDGSARDYAAREHHLLSRPDASATQLGPS